MQNFLTQEQSHDKNYVAFSMIGLLYLFLLVIPIPLPVPGTAGKLLLADIIAPIMVVRVLQRRPVRPFLMLFLGWCILATAIQCFHSAGGLYNIAITGYMALIYMYFRETPLPSPQFQLRTGFLLLALIFITWLALVLLGGNSALVHRMFYFDPHGEVLSSGPLMSRFQFLFTNPNLLGVAYAIPLALILPGVAEFCRQQQRKLPAVFIFIIIAILCLPLYSTMSKHAVMSFALLSALFIASGILHRRCAIILACIGVLAFGVLCLSTVWFRSYPAVREAPWFDFSHTSNYMTHQRVYADIISQSDVTHALFGNSTSQLQQLYPQYAEPHREWMQEVLEPYCALDFLAPFTTFMDPHNEYLNTAAFFGIPAVIFLIIFLLVHFFSAVRYAYWPMLLWLPALLLACFWDDLGSKRWIWAMLGILAARLEACRRTPRYHV